MGGNKVLDREICSLLLWKPAFERATLFLEEGAPLLKRPIEDPPPFGAPLSQTPCPPLKKPPSAQILPRKFKSFQKGLGPVLPLPIPQFGKFSLFVIITQSPGPNVNFLFNFGLKESPSKFWERDFLLEPNMSQKVIF